MAFGPLLPNKLIDWLIERELACNETTGEPIGMPFECGLGWTQWTVCYEWARNSRFSPREGALLPIIYLDKLRLAYGRYSAYCQPYSHMGQQRCGLWLPVLQKHIILVAQIVDPEWSISNSHAILMLLLGLHCDWVIKPIAHWSQHGYCDSTLQNSPASCPMQCTRWICGFKTGPMYLVAHDKMACSY